MGIHLKQLRVHGFRGLDNLEIDFEPTTVIVGINNAGKTTLLKSLQLALSNSQQITDDDFHFTEEDMIRDKIIIDILFISVDKDGKQIQTFEDEWAIVFTESRISFDSHNNQFFAFRTEIEEDMLRKSYKKKQFLIDEWKGFHNNITNEYWYSKTYNTELKFHFDEIPFFYLDANRDILDDLKNKTSFLGKLLSSVKYNDADKEHIETLIKTLNDETIKSSTILTDLHRTLEELDTTMDNPNHTVDITPFTKKIKDLNKGVKIHYSQFSMEYHGMGTRSWSSLLVLKAFILQNKKLSDNNKVTYYPIIAIEEPESHLHPNAQKKLYSQISHIEGQKIVATHSSYIAGSAQLKEVRSLCKEISQAGKFLESDFNEEDIRKVYRQVINTRGELFFSKIVILCEGETEEQALPIIFEKRFGKKSIELGVDFIGVSGSDNYLPFIRFCDAFNIPYLIFSDAENKTKNKVIKQIGESKLDKVVFLHDDNNFENELFNNGYIEEVKKACDRLELSKCENENHKIKKREELNKKNNTDYYNLVMREKTKIAPYIAEELCKSEKELPAKIIELFTKITLILKPIVNEN